MGRRTSQEDEKITLPDVKKPNTMEDGEVTHVRYNERIECSIKITGNCAICGDLLSWEFPDDFPDDWKWCCSCVKWGKALTQDTEEDWVKGALKNSKIVQKIYKKITLIKDERIHKSN